MDFISDAEMEKLDADFISDADMEGLSAPDFIPDESPSLVEQIPTDGGAITVKPLTQTESYLDTLKGMGSDYLEDVKKVGPIQAPINALGETALGLGAGMLSPLAGYANLVKQAFTEDQRPAEQIFTEGMEAVTPTPRSAMGKRIQEDVVTPIMENILMPLGGHVELMGGHVASERVVANMEKQLKSATPEMIKAQTALETIKEVKTPEQRQMLEFVDNHLNAKIDEIQKAATALGEKGAFGEEAVGILEALDKRMQELVKTKVSVEEILSGDITKEVTADQAAARDVRIQKKIAELKAARGPRTYVDPILAETDVARVEEALGREAIPEAVLPEKTLPETTIPETPKRPPIEVAVEKVAEAIAETPDKVADRILDVEDRLAVIKEKEATIPGADYSALKDSLQKELTAYEQIQKGEKNLDTLTKEWVEKPVEEVVATVPKHPDMVSLLSDADTPLLERLQSNEHLMTKTGNTRMDTRLSPTLQKIVGHFIKVAGLGNDNIFVVGMDDATLTTAGALNHVGNTSIIKMNIDQINKIAQSADTMGVSFGGMVGNKLANAKNTFAQVRVAAHEIGHIVFNKYLQNFITDGAIYADLLRKWDTYKKNNKFENISMFDFGADKRHIGLAERQKYFHEFFAEQMAKELLHKHTLGAFTKGSKIFGPLIEASKEVLKKAGINVEGKTFATEILQKIVGENKESIKATGETIWQKQERDNVTMLSNGNAPLFADKTLQQITQHARDTGMLPASKVVTDAVMALDVTDLPVVSNRVALSLGKGVGFLSRKMFGAMAQRKLNLKDRAVQSAYWTIKEAQEYSEAVVNRLWNNGENKSTVKFTDVLSKVKDSDSAYVAITKASMDDLATLQEVFVKGMEEELDYATNLYKNGQHLTADQQAYYNSFARLFAKMHEETIKVQTNLDKKWLLPEKAGWYPSVRTGKYAITISFGDVMAHRQHFQTQLQAEKFLEQLNRGDMKHFNVSEVIDTTREPVQANRQMADILREHLEKKLPGAKDFINEEVNRLLDSMNVRGGKLGQHHKYRFNIPGYKGTEFFKTREELGRSFKEAIESSVAEKGNQLKQMQIDHHLKTMLEDGELKQTKPNAHAVIQQMYDSALNRNNSIVKIEGVDQFANSVADSMAKWFGNEYKTDKDILASVHEGIKETFYLTKMMPKMVFSIIGQVLSVPAGTVSNLSYGGHGLRAYQSFAKGLSKLAMGDKELWKAIKEDSQAYNVFEPAFVEAMSMHDMSSKPARFLKNWVLMQAPGKAMDSASRVMVYAIAKTHYADLGLSETAARQRARQVTGDVLNLYDKANAAPMFSHAGGLGDITQPLMGFGQNALGSLIAAVKHVSPKDYKTWGPLVNFTLLTVATGGVMGMQFIQEYEQFRRYVNKNFNDFTLPSILDIFASDDGFLNRVQPLTEQQRQTVMYGLPSLTGLDLSSSVRANESFPALVAGVVGGWTDPNQTMAMLSWGASIPGALVDIAQAPNKSLAETRKAFDVIAPAGHLGYLAKKAVGIDKTNVMGETTDMLAGGSKATAYAEEQPLDVTAGILGAKTTDRRWNEQKDFETAEKERDLTAKKDRLGVLFTETGNPKFIEKMVELGMDEKQIRSKIELELNNRLTPQQIRMIANKAGKVTKGAGERKAIQLFKFGQGR